ncbi:MAG TPA: uroporphyrinogen decarboxylase family protein, partial [Sedimentisphaerales bacterium]|nr:uroporphyrinogen decarboxylase family protein [Sedimentisphaerales bacterium]
QIWLDAVRLTKKYFGDEKFIRGNCDQAPFSLASMTRGTSRWMMDLAYPENKTRIGKLLEFCTDAACQFVKLMAKTDADMVSNGDSPAGPDLISPQMYREFAWPYEKKVIDLSHELGLPYMLHICGNTNLIINDMVKLGADAIELDYKTDINLIHEKCADRLTFSGNIDPTAVMVQAGPEVVAQKVAQIGQIYKDSPRLIINAGCALPAETPSENLKALVKTARDLPIKG